MIWQISLFVASVVIYSIYTWFLFKNFRRKVYLDVVDFILAQKKKTSDELQVPPPRSSNRSHIRLVPNSKQKDGA